jgi:hypothetical protein
MDNLSNPELGKHKELWKDLDSSSSGKDSADGLVEELFAGQGISLKDSVNLLAESIDKRKRLTGEKAKEAQKRRDEIEVALKQFPLGTCYPHVEARRAHLERELHELLRDLKEEDVSAWKDVHGLYKDMIYFVFKYRALDTVKRAARSEPSGKG